MCHVIKYHHPGSFDKLVKLFSCQFFSPIKKRCIFDNPEILFRKISLQINVLCFDRIYLKMVLDLKKINIDLTLKVPTII